MNRLLLGIILVSAIECPVGVSGFQALGPGCHGSSPLYRTTPHRATGAGRGALPPLNPNERAGPLVSLLRRQSLEELLLSVMDGNWTSG